MRDQPASPEDVAAVEAVAEMLWQTRSGATDDVAHSFSRAKAAGATEPYERWATELWRRGWLDTIAIVSDAGGPNSA